MKKSILILSSLLVILSISCKYGIGEAFYRKNGINKRIENIKELDNPIPEEVGSKYTILMMSDVHFGSSQKRNDDEFIEKFKELCSVEDVTLRPRFAVNVGDVTEIASAEEYDSFLKVTSKMKEIAYEKMGIDDFKVYSITGNHDLYNDGWELYKTKLYPGTSFYSFHTGKGDKKIGWYFLDSGDGSLGKKQLNYLKTAMNNDDSKKIVYSHYPLYENSVFYYTFQNTEERDILLNLFNKRNVALVFAGHFHTGWEYDYGNFKEIGVRGYLDRRNVTLLTVNHETMEFNVKEVKF